MSHPRFLWWLILTVKLTRSRSMWGWLDSAEVEDPTWLRAALLYDSDSQTKKRGEPAQQHPSLFSGRGWCEPHRMPSFSCFCHASEKELTQLWHWHVQNSLAPRTEPRDSLLGRCCLAYLQQPTASSLTDQASFQLHTDPPSSTSWVISQYVLPGPPCLSFKEKLNLDAEYLTGNICNSNLL